MYIKSTLALNMFSIGTGIHEMKVLYLIMRISSRRPIERSVSLKVFAEHPAASRPRSQ
jgi:hypothetical protein